MTDQANFILRKIDDQKKKMIVESSENLVVTACPGSGKTRVLTYKLAYMAALYPNSQRRIVAITYTNRAAEEIKERLDLFDIDKGAIWAGTIHQFCLEFIVRPYALLSPRLSKGFKIIDEYVREQYLQEIAKHLRVDVKPYEFSKIITARTHEMKVQEQNYPDIVKSYHKLLKDKKEIDFDLILNAAYHILTANPVAAENISRMMRSVYVDEYQDTNEMQYRIIAALARANPGTQLMFVGDVDQAIYGTLGGIAKSVDDIQELTGLSFTSETLDGCYRSTQRIIDYYTHYQSVQYQVQSKSCDAYKPSIVSLNTSIPKDELPERIAALISSKLSEGIPQEEICVIAPQWRPLYSLSKKLRELLPAVSFDAPDISPIKADDLNVFYLLAKLIFTTPGEKVRRRKRIASEVIMKLSSEYAVMLSDYVDSYWILKTINSVRPQSDNGVEHFCNVVDHLFQKCEIEESSFPVLFDTYSNFIEKIKDRISKHGLDFSICAFCKNFSERSGVVIATCHKIKGEEYNTVIAFGLLEGFIPHWEVIFNTDDRGESEAEKLLYVIASRAKESLYLFSESGRVTNSGKPYQTTNVLRDYRYTYDD